MQLMLRRSQRDSGIVSQKVLFCLDARVEFTPPETSDLKRYKMAGMVIYNSEATERAAAGSAQAMANARAQGVGFGSVDDFLSSASSKLGHGLKAAALGAFAMTRLTITISSLSRGQHIECKSMDELIGAENAIMIACQNLKQYLDVAKTFDGTQVVISYDNGEPQVVAQTPGAIALVAPDLAPVPLDGPAEPAPAAIGYVGDDTAEAPSEWANDDEPVSSNDAFYKRLLIAIAVVIGIIVLAIAIHPLLQSAE